MCVLFYNTIARGLSTSTFNAAENGPSNHLLARVCVCVCPSDANAGAPFEFDYTRRVKTEFDWCGLAVVQISVRCSKRGYNPQSVVHERVSAEQRPRAARSRPPAVTP